MARKKGSKFFPPTVAKPDPDLPVNGQKKGSFIVAGHKVTPKEYAIFEYFHTCHSSTLTREHFGFSKQYLHKLTKQAWWKEMELETTQMWQAEFKSRYLANDSSLLGAYEDVLSGADLPNGVANAVMKGMELRLKASPDEVRAMLVPRADVTIENKETKEFNVNLITPERMKELKPVQISDWLLTGIAPPEITEVVDAEYEMIDEEGEE